MDRIVIDAGTAGKYFRTTMAAEVFDDSGHLIGVFQPAAALQPKIDRAEIERRKLDTVEYTTAEVIEYLEKL